MEDDLLKTALAPGDKCLSVDEIGRYVDGALDPAEHAAAGNHIRGCLSCQAELALLLAVTAANVRADEAALVREGVGRLEQLWAGVPADRGGVSRPRWFRFDTFRGAALAAVLLMGIAVGSSYLFFTRRAPQFPDRVTTGDEVTRSLSVRLRGPVGEQVEGPRAFEWLAVDGAVRYRVRLMEVDRQELWSTTTAALEAELPAAQRASIAPGKTLLWDVTAYDAAGGPIAESGLQSFKVVPR
jgi:hypothetical protein